MTATRGYALISSYGTIDVPNSADAVYDLLDGDRLYSYSSCGDAPSFFAWHGDGPGAVGLYTSCRGLGEVTGHALIHSTPEQATQLLEFSPGEVLDIEMSSEGGLMYLDYADRWQLYELAERRIVAEQPAEGPARWVRWSPDGRSMYRAVGSTLQRIDASGLERWAEDFGLLDSVFPSPAGDRLAVTTGDCGGLGSCITIVDANDGSHEPVREPRASELRWTPRGDALLVDGWWDSGMEPSSAAYWLDVETHQIHVVASACRSLQWSPDEEMGACMEPCAEEDDGLHRPLLFDTEGALVAEGRCDRYSGYPFWSLDSDAVALTVYEAPGDARSRVYLLDLEGRVHDLGPGNVKGGWRPGR